MEEEFWRNIEGYGEAYQVSSFGNVRSYKYKKSRILKTRANRRGYLYVNLCKDGKYKSKQIHRLVAETFIKGDKTSSVNHINENKKDNNIKNLEWCSIEDNRRKYIENNPDRGGENNPRHKLNKEDVLYIRNNYKRYKVSARSLGYRFGVSKTIILKVANNISYINIP